MGKIKLKEIHFVALLCLLTIAFTIIYSTDDSEPIDISKYEIDLSKQDSIIKVLEFKILERDSLITTLSHTESAERDTVFMLLEDKFEVDSLSKDSLIEEALKSITGGN